MYNGIGLSTARGSGTNGFIQRNLSLVKQFKNKINYKTEEELIKLEAQAIKGPNAEIREHARKRALELKCAELEDIMKEQGYGEEETRKRVDQFREMLMERQRRAAESTDIQKDFFGKPVVRETHAIAEAQQEKNARLKEAFGISSYFVEGSSLDPNRKAKEEAARLADGKKEEEETKKYGWVKTPSPSPERKKEKKKRKKKKKTKDRSSSEESRKKSKSKKHKHARSKSPQGKKKIKDKKKKKDKSKKKTRSLSPSSSASSSSPSSSGSDHERSHHSSLKRRTSRSPHRTHKRSKRSRSNEKQKDSSQYMYSNTLSPSHNKPLQYPDEQNLQSPNISSQNEKDNCSVGEKKETPKEILWKDYSKHDKRRSTKDKKRYSKENESYHKKKENSPEYQQSNDKWMKDSLPIEQNLLNKRQKQFSRSRSKEKEKPPKNDTNEDAESKQECQKEDTIEIENEIPNADLDLVNNGEHLVEESKAIVNESVATSFTVDATNFEDKENAPEDEEGFEYRTENTTARDMSFSPESQPASDHSGENYQTKSMSLSPSPSIEDTHAEDIEEEPVKIMPEEKDFFSENTAFMSRRITNDIKPSFDSYELSCSQSCSRSPSRSSSRHSSARTRSRSSSHSRSYSRSPGSCTSYSYSRSSRSRSPSIPRRRGSPSFLDRRRITSARKRPIPYHRPTPPPASPSSSEYSSWSRSRSLSWSPRTRTRSPSYSR